MRGRRKAHRGRDAFTRPHARAAASWGARPCPGLAPAATEDVCGARNFTPAFVLSVLARVDELFRLLLLSF